MHADEHSVSESSGNTNSFGLKPLPMRLVDPPSMESATKFVKPANALEALESSSDLRGLFSLYPKLREQLGEVYTATIEPSSEYQENEHGSNGRLEHGISRPGRRSRGRGRIGDNSAPWTPQRGRKLALSRLRKLRDCEGNDGNGTREFSRLVVQIGESK